MVVTGDIPLKVTEYTDKDRGDLDVRICDHDDCTKQYRISANTIIICFTVSDISMQTFAHTHAQANLNVNYVQHEIFIKD